MKGQAESRHMYMTMFTILLFSSLGCFVNAMLYPGEASETWVVIFMCLSLTVLMFYLLAVKPSLANYIIAIGLTVRIIWLILHSKAFGMPDEFLYFWYSADGYHLTAVDLLNNEYSRLRSSGYNIYPRILSLLYFMLGQSHLLAGWLNSLLYLVTVVYIKKIAWVLSINGKGVAVCVLTYSLMPFPILLTTGTFRENILIPPLVASAYYFFVWMKGGRGGTAIGSFALLLCSCYAHAGTTPVIAVYIFFFALYDRERERMRISLQAVIGIVSAIILLINVPNLPLFHNFFSKLGALWVQDIVTVIQNYTEKERGGSLYLDWVNIKNFRTLFWYVPLKYFYFYSSPVPWEWRGLQDASSFMLDGGIYTLLHCRGLFGFKEKSLRSFEWLALMMLVVGLGVVFAMGSYTAGTAIRHRLAALPFITLFAVYSSPVFRQGSSLPASPEIPKMDTSDAHT